ncbi:MAG: phytanoyl-CoA dioxygenase family protein, partial [Pseudomonadota bacterium]|nr:phytanoyl-CoA dioxygenase family protein [Pseudomonadota bacterium]
MNRDPESIKSATVKRVKALSAPKPLTHGLDPDHRNRKVIDKATAEVKELGYSIIPGFLSKQRLNLLRNDLAPIFEQSGIRNADQGGRYSGLQTVHVHNLFAKTRAVDEIAIDPVLLLIIEGILGSLFQLSVGTAMSPQPGVDPQGLHRDDGHYPLARPRPPFIANSLIALDDFTQANGATRIAPGSHKRTEDIKPNTDVIFAEMPAGSLLVFDGALWHAGGGNRTKDQRRRSINLNFNL